MDGPTDGRSQPLRKIETHQLGFFLELPVERIFLSIRRAFLIGLNRHRGNEEGRVGFASILLVHWNDHKSEKEIKLIIIY